MSDFNIKGAASRKAQGQLTYRIEQPAEEKLEFKFKGAADRKTEGDSSILGPSQPVEKSKNAVKKKRQLENRRAREMAAAAAEPAVLPAMPPSQQHEALPAVEKAARSIELVSSHETCESSVLSVGAISACIRREHGADAGCGRRPSSHHVVRERNGGGASSCVL